jgi:hypothetical protein
MDKFCTPSNGSDKIRLGVYYHVVAEGYEKDDALLSPSAYYAKYGIKPEDKWGLDIDILAYQDANHVCLFDKFIDAFDFLDIYGGAGIVPVYLTIPEMIVYYDIFFTKNQEKYSCVVDMIPSALLGYLITPDRARRRMTRLSQK